MTVPVPTVEQSYLLYLDRASQQTTPFPQAWINLYSRKPNMYELDGETARYLRDRIRNYLSSIIGKYNISRGERDFVKDDYKEFLNRLDEIINLHSSKRHI